MATGTGKTHTVLGMIYRFLTTNRFKRILFLVDRTSLGEQAHDVFREVKLEDLMTLDEIYNIKGLDDKAIDKETRIQVATVQGMVKRILYNKGDTMPAVTDYDLIIIDEAHRGYILDKEMDDAAILTLTASPIPCLRKPSLRRLNPRFPRLPNLRAAVTAPIPAMLSVLYGCWLWFCPWQARLCCFAPARDSSASNHLKNRH